MRNSQSIAARRLLCLTTWLIAAAMFLLPVQQAFAQGTMGAVPDPISSRELERYADRLGLSRQQRQAIEAMHDQYRAEFAQLRERDIEKFLSENRGMGGMGMLMDRDAAQKALRALEDIQNKIKAVDNRLFDQMQTVLAEDQAPRMTPVRMARERVRYRSGLSRMTAFLNPAAQIDLSELLADLNLTDQEKQAIDPALSQYESTLTGGARKLYDATISMMTEALDQMRAQGLSEDAMRDPERRGQMFQAFRTVMGDIQRKLAGKTADLSDLNRRTLRALTPGLAEDHARALRDTFHQRAYPEIGSGGGTTARAFDVALKFKELSDDQRASIAAMAGEYQASLDRIADQMMDLIDGNRKAQTFFDFDQDSRRKFDEQLGELRDRRSKLNESFVSNLRAALPPELVERLEKRVADGGKETAESEEISVVAVGGPGGAGAFSVVARAGRPALDNSEVETDPFLPGPITKHDVERYAETLTLAQEEKTILSSLHDDYMEKFQALEHDQFAAIKQAQSKLWAMDPRAGQVTPPTAQAIDELYALRKKALTAALALDQQLFSDIEIAIGDEQSAMIQRLQAARLRAVYGRAGSGGPGMMFAGRAGGAREVRVNGRGAGRGGMRFAGLGESGEANVDLAAVVTSLKITPPDAAAFDAALKEYEKAAVAAFQGMYEAAMRMQAARDKMMAQATRIEASRETRTFEFNDTMRTMMETEGKAAADARHAVTALNKSSLEKLMGALGPAEAHALRRAYNEKAFPSVFQDSRSAEPHLSAAMNLPDLSEQQRTQIQEIAIEFRGQYEQFCDQLVDLESAMPDFSGPPQNRDWQAIQQQIRTREKIEFDRNDLNDKALARLRATLNEQQIRQLGGLQPNDGKNG